MAGFIHPWEDKEPPNTGRALSGPHKIDKICLKCYTTP